MCRQAPFLLWLSRRATLEKHKINVGEISFLEGLLSGCGAGVGGSRRGFEGFWSATAAPARASDVNRAEMFALGGDICMHLARITGRTLVKSSDERTFGLKRRRQIISSSFLFWFPVTFCAAHHER